MYELEGEIWKPMPGFERYQISSYGRVYSSRSDKILVPDRNKHVALQQDRRVFSTSIPILMGIAFLGNELDNPYRNRVLFKDRDSSNYRLDNLYVEDTSDLPGEEWRPIHQAAGREVKDFYLVSNLGRVKSIKRELEWKNYGRISKKCIPETMLDIQTTEDGYKQVFLAAVKKPDINAQVHRLVAMAFCENDDTEHKTVVNHLDGDPSNNHADNLEWTTPSGNMQHAVATGLVGDHKGRKLRCPALHVETNKLYMSVSDIDRAMGRRVGYCYEHIIKGKPVTDKDGNVWTIQLLKDTYIKVPGEGQHCTIDEFPGKEFISLSEASQAIGRYSGYIKECLNRNAPVRNKNGEVLHVHLIGDEPEYARRFKETYRKRKEAGLIPEPKQRTHSEWKAKKPVRCIETGNIYSSLSDADRFLGKHIGYLSECFAYSRECFDVQGNKWTFEQLDPNSVHIHYKINACYIEEFPDKEFANMTEASLFIGRSEGYIGDRIAHDKPIVGSDGMKLTFHFFDEEKEKKFQSKLLVK